MNFLHQIPKQDKGTKVCLYFLAAFAVENCHVSGYIKVAKNQATRINNTNLDTDLSKLIGNISRGRIKFKIFRCLIVI